MNNIKELWKIFKWGMKYLYKISPIWFCIRVVALFVKNLSFILESYAIALIINGLIELGSKNLDVANSHVFLNSIILFLALHIFTQFFSEMSYYADFVFGKFFDLKSKINLADKLLTLNQEDLEDPENANIISRINSFNSNLDEFIIFSCLGFLVSLVSFFTGISIVFMKDPLIAFLLLTVAIPTAVNQTNLNIKFARFDIENTEKTRLQTSLFGYMTDISYTRETALLNTSSYFRNIIKQIYDVVETYKFKLYQRLVTFRFVMSFLKIFVILAGMIRLIMNGIDKIGGAGLLTFYLNLYFKLSNDLATAFSKYGSISERKVRYIELMNFYEKPPIKSTLNKVENTNLPKLEISPFISFRKVSFHYPNSEKVILKDINLDIKAGENIAIVGENGAGKTTFTKLLCKFYSEYSGKILVNNQNLADVTRESWYQNLGVLFQDYNTYGALSVKENVMLGDLTKQDEAYMKECLELATAKDFVEAYDMKYEKILSERFKGGVKPSTGQWQKIAIAKFLYRNAPVIIFDEPTSSIDAISEKQIFDNIFDHFSDKTVIIISHRFSTVRRADRIIVLANGTIAEIGTHDELMKLGGIYANSYKIQAEGYKD